MNTFLAELNRLQQSNLFAGLSQVGKAILTNAQSEASRKVLDNLNASVNGIDADLKTSEEQLKNANFEVSKNGTFKNLEHQVLVYQKGLDKLYNTRRTYSEIYDKAIANLSYIGGEEAGRMIGAIKNREVNNLEEIKQIAELPAHKLEMARTTMAMKFNSEKYKELIVEKNNRKAMNEMQSWIMVNMPPSLYDTNITTSDARVIKKYNNDLEAFKRKFTAQFGDDELSGEAFKVVVGLLHPPEFREANANNPIFKSRVDAENNLSFLRHSFNSFWKRLQNKDYKNAFIALSKGEDIKDYSGIDQSALREDYKEFGENGTYYNKYTMQVLYEGGYPQLKEEKVGEATYKVPAEGSWGRDLPYFHTQREMLNAIEGKGELIYNPVKYTETVNNFSQGVSEKVQGGTFENSKEEPNKVSGAKPKKESIGVSTGADSSFDPFNYKSKKKKNEPVQGDIEGFVVLPVDSQEVNGIYEVSSTMDFVKKTIESQKSRIQTKRTMLVGDLNKENK